jgi:uncharacterized protein YecE (DUF72 family)
VSRPGGAALCRAAGVTRQNRWMAIVVETGGWSAPEWYEPGIEARDRLAAYARRLDAVEVDSAFYALPALRTVSRWAEITPDGFTFDVKLHRLLSRHAAPLNSLPGDLRHDVEVTDRGRVKLTPELEAEMCRRTLETVRPLHEEGKLSAFLLQLTPAFAPGEHRLDELDGVIGALAPVPVAVELRQRDWLARPERTLAWYREQGAAFVSVDLPRVDAPITLPPFDAVTRDVAYLRAHGRNREGYLKGRSAGERFDWEYADEELEELAARARTLAEDAETVRVAFANGGHAMAAALRMRELLA